MKRLLMLLATSLFILGGIASPAGAARCHPAIGGIDVQFNVGVILGTGAAPDVSYIGDITFDDQTHVLVWYPLTNPAPAQGQLIFAEEIWAIYESVNYEFDDVTGVLTIFETGPLLLAGSDVAFGTPSGQVRGRGPVTDAPATDGPLGCVTVGSSVFWTGTWDPPEVGPGTHFIGKFRVFPTNH